MKDIFGHWCQSNTRPHPMELELRKTYTTEKDDKLDQNTGKENIKKQYRKYIFVGHSEPKFGAGLWQKVYLKMGNNLF